MKRNIIKSILFVLLLISIAFLVKNIYFNWRQIKTFSFRPNYFTLSLSFLIETFIQFAGVYLWLKIVKLFNVSISYRKVLRIWFVSSLGRYLPGKIWHFAGMTYFLTKEGISTEISFTSSFLVQIYSIITGIFIGIFALTTGLKNINNISIILFASLGLVIIICLSNKKIINFLLFIISRKRIQSSQIIEFKSIDLQMLIFMYFFFWLIRGFGFYLFIISFTFIEKTSYMSISQILTAISIFSASYISGLLFLLSPGGIGIRESVMSTLINSCLKIPIGISSVITIFNRIMMSIIEMFCLLISLIINRRKNEEKR